VEKVLRGDVVMSHQPQQGGTVALPVVLAQLGSGAFRQVQPLHHKRRHGPVDMGKNVGAGVVQGIVQIEDPDRSSVESGHGGNGPAAWRRAPGDDSGRKGLVGLDQGADAHVRENFQQQGMFHPAIDDVHAFHPRAGRVQGVGGLW